MANITESIITVEFHWEKGKKIKDGNKNITARRKEK